MASAALLIPPRRVMAVLWAMAATLVIIHSGMLIYREATGSEPTALWRFYLNEEGNAPTWFSVALLLLAAGLLAAIAAAKRQAGAPYVFHWLLLAVGFLAMSFDEAARFHESAGRFVSKLFDADGFFYSWLAPGLILVFVLGVVFLGFLRHLSARSRIRFVIAGATFFLGILGVEIVGGARARTHGHDAIYELLVTVEEALELCGVLLFIRALFLYIQEELPDLRVGVEPKPEPRK